MSSNPPESPDLSNPSDSQVTPEPESVRLDAGEAPQIDPPEHWQTLPPMPPPLSQPQQPVFPQQTTEPAVDESGATQQPMPMPMPMPQYGQVPQHTQLQQQPPTGGKLWLGILLGAGIPILGFIIGLGLSSTTLYVLTGVIMGVPFWIMCVAAIVLSIIRSTRRTGVGMWIGLAAIPIVGFGACVVILFQF